MNKDWDLAITLDRGDTEPLYIQLVKAVEEGIRKGRFKPGEPLPGTRALADHLGVNRNTTQAAYQELQAEGWVEVLPDNGTFIARKLPLFQELEQSIATGDSGSWTSPTPLDQPFYQPGIRDRESFHLLPDLPDVRVAPTAMIHRAYGRVLKNHSQDFLQPAWDPRGLLDLRISLCKMLRDLRGLAVEPGNLVLTRGLMSTLNLVSRVLFAPGEAVAMETPGHFRIAEAFRAAGARLFPIPVDTQGLDVDALETLLATEPLRLVYLTARPQYPTHAVLSPERGKRLLELSHRFGFRILEGDPTFGFQKEKNPSLPLAAEDPEGRVIYFSALEQILAPGLQVGFLVGPGWLIKSLAQQRQLVDWPGNQVQEATIEELFRDGEISRHLRRVRKLAEERRETMVDRLLLHLGPAIEVKNPREGLSLWLRVREDIAVDTWTQRCAAKGVVFYPGCLYDFDRKNIPYVCLGFTSLDLDEQNEACVRMAEALEEARR